MVKNYIFAFPVEGNPPLQHPLDIGPALRIPLVRIEGAIALRNEFIPEERKSVIARVGARLLQFRRDSIHYLPVRPRDVNPIS